jgi:hypothetical protein
MVAPNVTQSVNTNINFPQVPFLDPTTGYPSLPWLLWLQNPNVVSQTVNHTIITGGDINSTVIGDKTPATGTFTNLTALLGIGGGQF